jgi:putative ABC transport system permease protein
VNYIQIHLGDLLIATGLLSTTLIISLKERLGLEKDLIVGAIRSFVQLMVIGYILQFIFDLNRWYLVILMLMIMLTAAGTNAFKRQQSRWKKLFWIITTAIAIGSVIVLFLVIGVVLKVKPWYLPQYLIPLAGMIIGNSMVGAALAANRLATDLQQHRGEIELALSLGATARQAAQPYLKDSLKTSMMPTISSMMTVGLVQLPGMMTGQIIAGTNPNAAVRYQIVVVYMISAATAITVIIIVLWLFRCYFTPYYQLLREPR